MSRIGAAGARIGMMGGASLWDRLRTEWATPGIRPDAILLPGHGRGEPARALPEPGFMPAPAGPEPLYRAT